MSESAFLMMLVLAPAGIAIVSLALAVYLFSQARHTDGVKPTLFRVIAILLTLVGLGIGACYATLFVG
ncbi:hypothetical protein [Sandaracinus amylolyticus]|uniref:Uncharacterized protein n=1 Tax=Sandaracinus amylolyticus TaxID=927083 RepID=A0A0F6W6U9_9BACT|nr:hypothetical protein [Sandaracinus amylolyticus]AKF08923.1 hypothetical protein DB32_006072 [Sandaracinus amylolyticus]